jgi:acetyl esterase/lipase
MGGGGGWPETLTDVGAAVDRLSTVAGVDLGRVVTCGHSAGGQLALWLASRHAGAPGSESGSGSGSGSTVAVRAAVALAGVVDLEAGAELGLGDGAVAQFLGGTPEQVPERYQAASPAALVPLGVPQLLVHGTADTVVPPTMSERYRARATAHGDDVLYRPLDGVGHREVISRSGPAWTAVADFLGSLLD